MSNDILRKTNASQISNGLLVGATAVIVLCLGALMIFSAVYFGGIAARSVAHSTHTSDNSR